MAGRQNCETLINESVGVAFDEQLLVQARNLTLEVIEETAVKIGPGCTEGEARQIVKEILISKGCESSWHAPQVRFGLNTLRAFGEKGEEGIRLKDDDVFFLDLGPVFHGHEGDVGRTYAFGSDSEILSIQKDVQTIWQEVRDHWFKSKLSGSLLYEFAQQRASALGWILCLNQADGHRVADFPHIARQRGSIEGLKNDSPAALRWILEIQIRHPSRPFGAFFEDLLL